MRILPVRRPPVLADRRYLAENRRYGLLRSPAIVPERVGGSLRSIAMWLLASAFSTARGWPFTQYDIKRSDCLYLLPTWAVLIAAYTGSQLATSGA